LRARERECASLVRGALGERGGDEGLAGQGHREADDDEQRREHRRRPPRRREREREPHLANNASPAAQTDRQTDKQTDRPSTERKNRSSSRRRRSAEAPNGQQVSECGGEGEGCRNGERERELWRDAHRQRTCALSISRSVGARGFRSAASEAPLSYLRIRRLSFSRLFRPEHPTIYRREGKVREREREGEWRMGRLEVLGSTFEAGRLWCSDGKGCSHWGRQHIGMGWSAVRDSSRSVHRASERGSSRTHHD